MHLAKCLSITCIVGYLLRVKLDYIRTNVEGYGYDMEENFALILMLDVGENYLQCFETGKNISCMNAEQIDQILNILLKLIYFFENKLEVA